MDVRLARIAKLEEAKYDLEYAVKVKDLEVLNPSPGPDNESLEMIPIILHGWESMHFETELASCTPFPECISLHFFL